MKKLLLLAVLFVGCSKKDKTIDLNQNQTPLQMLTRGTWVCDSGFKTVNGVTTIQHLEAGESLKVTYYTDNTYKVQSSYDGDMMRRYEFAVPKIYYWSLQGQKDPNSYSTVVSLTLDYLKLSESKSLNETFGYYFHNE